MAEEAKESPLIDLDGDAEPGSAPSAQAEAEPVQDPEQAAEVAPGPAVEHSDPLISLDEPQQEVAAAAEPQAQMEQAKERVEDADPLDSTLAAADAPDQAPLEPAADPVSAPAPTPDSPDPLQDIPTTQSPEPPPPDVADAAAAPPPQAPQTEPPLQDPLTAPEPVSIAQPTQPTQPTQPAQPTTQSEPTAPVAPRHDVLTVRRYLDATIVPVLRMGMRELCVKRPDDPFQFLADYILQHRPK